MVRPSREKLTGSVGVDETYVGGIGKKTRGRDAKRKSIVAIAAEIRGRGLGRIRMSIISDVSSASLHEFVTTHVVPGAEINTDGWTGYNGLNGLGYEHVVTNISASGDPAHLLMP